MLLVFGKSSCEICKEKLKELQESGEIYQYYDLNTATGLAKAAALDLLSKPQGLPIMVKVEEVSG